MAVPPMNGDQKAHAEKARENSLAAAVSSGRPSAMRSAMMMTEEMFITAPNR